MTTGGTAQGEQARAGEATAYRSVWAIPAWRLAFPAAVISRLGDIVFDTTMVLWISTGLARGESWAPAAVGGVLIAAALPVLLVGPIAGVVVDRTDRHRVMVLSNLLQTMTMGSLLIVPALGARLDQVVALVWVYAVVVVTNAAGQFFGQARMTMIAGTVPESLRPSAFSMLQASGSSCLILGPPLAAPLFFALGESWAIGLDAASFLVSTLLLWPVQWNSRPSQQARARFLASLAEGALLVGRNPVMRSVVIAVSVVTLGAGAINVLEVFFVTDVLHVPAERLGVLMGAYAVGTIAGSLVAPILGRRFSTASVFVWGLAACGALLAVYSRVTDFEAALVLYFVMAVRLGAANALLGPLFMSSIPDSMLGRAAAAVNVFPTVASLIAMGAAGWLVSTLLRGLDLSALGTTFGPVDTIFFLAGALFLGTALAVRRPLMQAATP